MSERSSPGDAAKLNSEQRNFHVYLPPDANTLLSVTVHCMRSRNWVNVIVAGKQPAKEGTTTTPFDMAVLNDIDRFHLVKDVVDRAPGQDSRAVYLTQLVRDKLIGHKRYIERYGDDTPEIRDWR